MEAEPTLTPFSEPQHFIQEVENTEELRKITYPLVVEVPGRPAEMHNPFKVCTQQHIEAAQTVNHISTLFSTPTYEWTGPKIPYNLPVFDLPHTLGTPGIRLIKWDDICESRIIQDGNRRRIA
uniref:Uncharacterized protein n=1 Tax=Moniliophthora roreri TaxID=221103 RepID=A0A0W0FE93_MONRR